MNAGASAIRYLAVLCMLAATGLVLHIQKRLEIVPNPPRLESFPMLVGDWNGHPEAIGDNIRKVLGDGDFLSRTYSHSTSAPVSLFVAYFRSQATGQTMHSPKNCLPGAGWMPIESDKILISTLLAPGVVNRYVIERAGERALVLYWYQAHARVIASEYSAKGYLVWDAIRLHRSDGALVRIVTPIANGEDIQRAELRATGFAQQIAPDLDRYIPR